MKNTFITLAFALILSPAVFSCHKQGKQSGEIDFIPQDSIYLMAQDSLFSRPAFSRQLLQTEMSQPLKRDSFYWYLLYNLYTKTFFYTSELDSIAPLCRKTIQYCQSKPEMSPYEYYLMTDVYNNMGNRYGVVSENDSAIKYFNLTIEYARLAQNKTLMIQPYANIADVYTRSGRYTEGAHYYRQALLMADSLNSGPSKFIILYAGLGHTYKELGDYETANKFYDQAFALSDQMNLNDKFIYYNNRGSLKYFEEDYPAAKELFLSGYELVKNNTDFAFAQNILKLNIGEIYMLTGNLDSAQLFLQDSFDFFKTVGHETAVYHAYTQMLELALQEGNLTRASEILKQAGETHSTEPTMINIRKKYLQHYYEETGNYQKAYQYQTEYLHLDDSIRNDRIRMRVAEIDLRYKQDTTLMKQTFFIQQQQSDMQSLELSIFIWILVCGLVLATAIFIYFYQKKQRAYLLVQTRNKIIGLRMENVRNRISPHFIFNTLNRVISGYKETDSSYKELHNLIKIMRLNLKLTEKLCITLAKEFDFVQTYLDLEQQRIGPSLQISIRIDPQIAPQHFQIPAMMIQIPAENAIKHGLRDKDGEKRLAISVSKEPGFTCICIEDNGRGFHLQVGGQDLQSTGTGLRVINQTIQLLNASNREPICLSFEAGKQGTPENPGCRVIYAIPEQYSFVLPEGK